MRQESKDKIIIDVTNKNEIIRDAANKNKIIKDAANLQKKADSQKANKHKKDDKKKENTYIFYDRNDIYSNDPDNKANFINNQVDNEQHYKEQNGIFTYDCGIFYIMKKIRKNTKKMHNFF